MRTHTSRKAEKLIQKLLVTIEEIRRLEDGPVVFDCFLRYDPHNSTCRDSTNPICTACRGLHNKN